MGQFTTKIPMIQLLLASFISHGFLDFYTFTSGVDLAVYSLIILAYLCGMYTAPTMCVFVFVVLSMFHFGNDFAYFRLPRWSGMVLFSSTALVDFNVWRAGLTILDVQYPTQFTLIITLLLFPGLLLSWMHTPWSTLATLLVGLGGVANIFWYSCLLHAPLGVYRFQKKLALLLWSGSTVVVYFLLPYVHLYQWILKLSVSIVMSHIVAISYWQYHHKKISVSGLISAYSLTDKQCVEKGT